MALTSTVLSMMDVLISIPLEALENDTHKCLLDKLNLFQDKLRSAQQKKNIVITCKGEQCTLSKELIVPDTNIIEGSKLDLACDLDVYRIFCNFILGFHITNLPHDTTELLHVAKLYGCTELANYLVQPVPLFTSGSSRTSLIHDTSKHPFSYEQPEFNVRVESGTSVIIGVCSMVNGKINKIWCIHQSKCKILTNPKCPIHGTIFKKNKIELHQTITVKLLHDFTVSYTVDNVHYGTAFSVNNDTPLHLYVQLSSEQNVVSLQPYLCVSQKTRRKM
jgi:ankyrin repeat protein